MSDQRFEAAKAAMQGVLANPTVDYSYEGVASSSVKQADALLAELARTAPQPSAPDALLLARLEAAEAVCLRLHHPDWKEWVPGRELTRWIAAKAAHESPEVTHGS